MLLVLSPLLQAFFFFSLNAFCPSNFSLSKVMIAEEKSNSSESYRFYVMSFLIHTHPLTCSHICLIYLERSVPLQTHKSLSMQLPGTQGHNQGQCVPSLSGSAIQALGPWGSLWSMARVLPAFLGRVKH